MGLGASDGGGHWTFMGQDLNGTGFTGIVSGGQALGFIQGCECMWGVCVGGGGVCVCVCVCKEFCVMMFACLSYFSRY